MSQTDGVPTGTVIVDNRAAMVVLRIYPRPVPKLLIPKARFNQQLALCTRNIRSL